MTKSNNAHHRALEKIVANPEKFGFNHIVSASIEQNLYHNGKGLLAQPDIILESSTGDIHIIEYKGNGDERLMERAQGQLANAAWWFGRYEWMFLRIKYILILSWVLIRSIGIY